MMGLEPIDSAARAGEPRQRNESLADLTDEELIAQHRRRGPGSQRCLEVLFERSYEKVARWCLRISGDRDGALDLAQEVFARVHERLDTFRLESRFATWLYVVTRSVAINRGQAERRRSEAFPEAPPSAELRDPAPGAHRLAAANEEMRILRDLMAKHLDPLESRVLYLHFVDGLTLPAITRLLRLPNQSGAKAYIVNGKRKLRNALEESGSSLEEG